MSDDVKVESFLGEEQFSLLLADVDDALATGKSTETPITVELPTSMRERLNREVDWYRLVRRLLQTTRSAAPDDPTLSPRVATLGRFLIRRELGRGGFGVVFLAYDPKLGRDVALKVPRPEVLVHPELRSRFQHEARAAAGLDHPNLVAVYDAADEGGVCYIASAYCPGTTLRDWLKSRTQPVPFRVAARLSAILAEAVEHAHRRGILHRDLKPGNIMLTQVSDEATSSTPCPPDIDFVPRIMDFGLAKVLQDDGLHSQHLTQTGAIVGTPTYMAPEQAGGQNHAVGPATDVYALGVILYELLAGRPPFQNEGPVETLLDVRTREPLPPSRLRTNVPRNLETICLKCLQKDPRKRYSSAQELADDLHRYLNKQPIAARRVGLIGRLVLWCQRKPALATTIALAWLAVGLVAGAGLYQVFEERERFRRERDRSQANLYRALVGETRALMKARDTGWWWQAMDNIRQAANLEVAERDSAELRELAIQCIGTQHPCMRLLGAWPGHTAPVVSTAFSPDGRIVASASRDRTVRLWSVPDGRPLAVLADHSQGVTGVVFHPAGRWLASSSADGTIRLYDIASWLQLKESATPPTSQVFALKAGAVHAIEWSANGAALAAAGEDGNVHLFAFEPDKPLTQWDRRLLTGHSAAVICLAFSDAGQLVSGSQDKTIRFWDTLTGKQMESWTTGEPPNTLVFSPDYGGALVWGTPQSYGIARSTLSNDRSWAFGQLHPNAVLQVRCIRSVIRHRLLTSSADGTVKLWKNFGGGAGQRLDEDAVARSSGGAVHSIAVNADQNKIAAGSADGQIRLWELAEPSQRDFLEDNTHSTAFVGGKLLLASPSWHHDLSRGWDRTPKFLHPPPLAALAVNPRDDRFAIGDKTGDLAIVNGHNPGKILQCGGHPQSIAALAASPAGKQFASASADGTVKLWNWDTGECLHTLEPGLGPLHSLAWSSNDEILAITGEQGVAVSELQNKNKLRMIQQQSTSISRVAVFGDFVAFSGPDATVAVCDLQTGRHLHTLHGHNKIVSALAFSPDGKLLASGAPQERLRLWDVTKAFAEVEVLDHPSFAFQWLAFDPRGQLLASPFHVWDLRSKPPAPAARLIGGTCGQFSSAGSGLLVGNDQGSVRQWTVADIDKARAQAQGKSSTAPSDFVPVLPSPAALVKRGHTSTVWGLAASPDGRWIATASHDETVKLWDVQTRKLVRTLEGHPALVWAVAFSPDSKYLASGSADEESGCIKVWDVATGEERREFRGHKRLVFGLAFHPNGRLLASGAADGSVCLWDVAEGKSLGMLHQFERAVYSVAFHPDGRTLAASCLDKRVALWNIAETPQACTPPTRFLEGHTGSVYAVGFSADGRYLASGSEEGEILLWDAKTFTPVTKLHAETGQIRSISFSRDGQFLAGSAYLRATIVWNLSLVRRTLVEMNLDWPNQN